MTKRHITAPKLDGYDYQSHIGSGGFADVFKYVQHFPQRDVAVKVWHRDVSDQVKQRFSDEANVMAQVSSHPAIVGIYSADFAQDGRPYLIMEYCPPPHLGQRVRNQPLSVPNALDIMIHIASAVETAHRAGIIHRDIKPANILINRYGNPMLTDFGIAATAKNVHTARGASLAWSPPEQQRGVDASGPRTDVFSLGATLYALCDGDSPFRVAGGDNSPQMLRHRVFHQQFTPLSHVPPQLNTIIARCLAINPLQRYSSAQDFAYALQSVQRQLGLQVTGLNVLTEGGHTVAPVDAHVDTHPDSDDKTRIGRVLEGEKVDAKQAYRFTMPEVEPLDPAHKLPSTVPQQTQPKPRPTDEQSPTKTSPRTLTSVVIALVVLLVVGGFVGWTVLHGKGTMTDHRQSASVHTEAQDAGLGSVVPPVDNLTARKDDEGARITWDNPSPLEGDTYLWMTSDEQVLHDTTDTEIVVDWDGDTCVEVTLRRATGQSSPVQRVCSLTP